VDLFIDHLWAELKRLEPEHATDAQNPAPSPETSTEGTALEEIAALLPCDQCRGAERNVGHLGRLGRHERRILLAAAPAGAEAPRVVEPETHDRSAVEAHRRALCTLEKAGLVDLRDRRAARRSILGQGIIDRLGDALAAGRRIRWAEHRPALLASVRRTPNDLLTTLHCELVAAGKEKRRVAMLTAALGKPDAALAAAYRVTLVEAVRRAVESALSTTDGTQPEAAGDATHRTSHAEQKTTSSAESGKDQERQAGPK